MHLSALHVYPVKGARGIALGRAHVSATGLAHDRRFMVVDHDGLYLTQRTHPRLTLVTTALTGTSLLVGAPSLGDPVTVPLVPEGTRRAVRIWDDEVEAVVIAGAASELLSAHLGERCSLVYMPSDVRRPIESPHGKPDDRVGFADAFPILLTTVASLRDLNTRLAARGKAEVPMSRFRPNIVVAGGAAFAEDLHPRVRIGAVALRTPKPCSRCKVTTIDQDTGASDKEPLQTLSLFRTGARGRVLFGQNAIPDHEGWISIGDEVRYEAER